MDIRNSRAICLDAQQALHAQHFDPKKLALLHTGAAAVFSLLLTVLNFLLGKQIENAVGLSGVGLRAVLTTAQSVLSIASFAIIPFWEMGFTAAGLRFARQEQAEPATLLQGFRIWGGVLRLTLLRFVFYIAIMFACAQVASVIYTLTPFSAPFMEAMLTGRSSDPGAAAQHDPLVYYFGYYALPPADPRPLPATNGRVCPFGRTAARRAAGYAQKLAADAQKLYVPFPVGLAVLVVLCPQRYHFRSRLRRSHHLLSEYLSTLQQ